MYLRDPPFGFAWSWPTVSCIYLLAYITSYWLCIVIYLHLPMKDVIGSTIVCRTTMVRIVLVLSSRHFGSRDTPSCLDKDGAM